MLTNSFDSSRVVSSVVYTDQQQVDEKEHKAQIYRVSLKKILHTDSSQVCSRAQCAK